MSSASFNKLQAKYGGMKELLMGRMNKLEAEDNRLMKMYADVQLQNDVIKEAMAKWLHIRSKIDLIFAKKGIIRGGLSFCVQCFWPKNMHKI